MRKRRVPACNLLDFAAGKTELPDAIPVKYPSPTLRWRVERPKDVHVTFLRATNAAGNVIKPMGAASGTGQGGERYARELQVPAGVRGAQEPLLRAVGHSVSPSPTSRRAISRVCMELFLSTSPFRERAKHQAFAPVCPNQYMRRD